MRAAARGNSESLTEAALCARTSANPRAIIGGRRTAPNGRRPKNLLEYVIVHGMAHLLVPNHSGPFIALLDEHYPGWRDARAELNDLPLAAEEWRE